MAKESGWAAAIDRYLDQLTTVIMGLAALLSAWSSYQSSRWDSAKTAAYALAASARKEASRLDIRANQQYQIDWSVFQGYMLARLHEDDTVATFYEQRLPPRLRTVFAEWLALQPERNRAAPPHPFALPSYTIPDAEAARRQTERSDEQDYQALRASHISGRYTRTTVSFALVLFFAGLAPRGVRRQSRLLMLALSIAFLVIAGLTIATLPVLI